MKVDNEIEKVNELFIKAIDQNSVCKKAESDKLEEDLDFVIDNFDKQKSNYEIKK